jgi:hypothetical protein
MRVVLAILMIFGAGLALTATQAGEKTDKKEVTLKGRITCAKCDLGVETDCMTVIVYKDKKDNKDITVYFDKESNKKHHASICTDAKKGTVTGIVKDDDKKKTIAVKTLKFE